MRRLNTFPGEDALSELLRTVRVRSTVYCHSELSAPWGFRIDGRAAGSFHLVTEGECWLRVDSADGVDSTDGDDRGDHTNGADPPRTPIRLQRGDLVILPNGHGHELRDAPSRIAPPLEQVMRGAGSPDGRTLRYGGGGARTELLCGQFAVEAQPVHPALAALPAVVCVRGSEGRPPAWLESTLSLIRRELGAWSAGGDAVLTRLTDVLLTQAVRDFHAQACEVTPRRFRDAEVSVALRVIHAEPERRWTLDQLAAQVALSRSALALRFRRVTGESLARYLARYRLTRASEYLRTSSVSLREIAASTGYDSEVSFSKAFRRWFGVPPGEFRRAALRNMA